MCRKEDRRFLEIVSSIRLSRRQRERVWKRESESWNVSPFPTKLRENTKEYEGLTSVSGTVQR